VPEGVSCLVFGNEMGDLINNDHRIPLVSFTGSTELEEKYQAKWQSVLEILF
jgi:acyl-CoA reductase-like NAD-dependent aldehyde dehydrogenase